MSPTIDTARFCALLDTDALCLDGVSLDDWQIQQAALESQTLEPQMSGGIDRGWQHYLNRLAFFGLQNWLGERDTELLQRQLPAPHNSLRSTDILQVGAFRVGAIALSSLPDTIIDVPRRWIDSAQSSCHFYVLVEVLEEQEQIRMYGYLRRDQLQHQTETANLPCVDDTYPVPLAWFNPEMDQLLLHLRCLPVEAIAAKTQSARATVHRQVAQSQSAQLTQPAWSNPTAGVQLGQTSQASVAQPLLNTAVWLRNQIDAIAQEWGWALIPQLQPALRSVRSPVAQFDQVITQLRQSGMEIPLQARGVYREFCWGKAELRLYVLTWNLEDSPGEPEWSFLVILGAQPNAWLPPNIRLQIQDDKQVLVERASSEQDLGAHLYGQVVGTWSESFQVSIHLNHDNSVTLPPFSFTP